MAAMTNARLLMSAKAFRAFGDGFTGLDRYEAWTRIAKPGIYLEDVFVIPQYRSRGVGRALLARLAAIARYRDCGRIEWAVLDWNEPAIAFYRRRLHPIELESLSLADPELESLAPPYRHAHGTVKYLRK